MPASLIISLPPSLAKLPSAPTWPAPQLNVPRLAAQVCFTNACSLEGYELPVVHEGVTTSYKQLLADHVPMLLYEENSGKLMLVSADDLHQQLILPDGRITTPRVLVGEGARYASTNEDGMPPNLEDTDASFTHIDGELDLQGVLRYCCVNATTLASPNFEPQTILSNMQLIFADVAKAMSTRQRRVWKYLCDDAVKDYQGANGIPEDATASSARST